MLRHTDRTHREYACAANTLEEKLHNAGQLTCPGFLIVFFRFFVNRVAADNRGLCPRIPLVTSVTLVTAQQRHLG